MPDMFFYDAFRFLDILSPFPAATIDHKNPSIAPLYGSGIKNRLVDTIHDKKRINAIVVFCVLLYISGHRNEFYREPEYAFIQMYEALD